MLWKKRKAKILRAKEVYDYFPVAIDHPGTIEKKTTTKTMF